MKDNTVRQDICSVQWLSRVWLFATPWTAARQAFLSITITPRAYSNSCPLSQWCHPIILSSVVPFSSCPQSSATSGSFPMSQFFASCGQNIGPSSSASVLLMNIKDWFPLVSPKGNQPWTFIGRTDAEAEAPILLPSAVKNWLIGKDPDVEKDQGQEGKGTTKDEMVE